MYDQIDNNHKKKKILIPKPELPPDFVLQEDTPTKKFETLSPSPDKSDTFSSSISKIVSFDSDEDYDNDDEELKITESFRNKMERKSKIKKDDSIDYLEKKKVSKKKEIEKQKSPETVKVKKTKVEKKISKKSSVPKDEIVDYSYAMIANPAKLTSNIGRAIEDLNKLKKKKSKSKDIEESHEDEEEQAEEEEEEENENFDDEADPEEEEEIVLTPKKKSKTSSRTSTPKKEELSGKSSSKKASTEEVSPKKTSSKETSPKNESIKDKRKRKKHRQLKEILSLLKSTTVANNIKDEKFRNDDYKWNIRQLAKERFDQILTDDEKKKLREREDLLEKRELIYEFYLMQQRYNITSRREFTEKDSLDEMRYEFLRTENQIRINRKTERNWKLFSAFTTLGASINDAFSPFGIKLKEFTLEIDKDQEEYKDIFRRMQKNKLMQFKSNPWADFGLQLLSSFTFYIAPKITSVIESSRDGVTVEDVTNEKNNGEEEDPWNVKPKGNNNNQTTEDDDENPSLEETMEAIIVDQNQKIENLESKIETLSKQMINQMEVMMKMMNQTFQNHQSSVNSHPEVKSIPQTFTPDQFVKKNFDHESKPSTPMKRQPSGSFQRGKPSSSDYGIPQTLPQQSEDHMNDIMKKLETPIDIKTPESGLNVKPQDDQEDLTNSLFSEIKNVSKALSLLKDKKVTPQEMSDSVKVYKDKIDIPESMIETLNNINPEHRKAMGYDNIIEEYEKRKSLKVEKVELDEEENEEDEEDEEENDEEDKEEEDYKEEEEEIQEPVKKENPNETIIDFSIFDKPGQRSTRSTTSKRKGLDLSDLE